MSSAKGFGYVETSSSPTGHVSLPSKSRAEPDVVDAGDLAHVLDVVGHLRDRGLRHVERAEDFLEDSLPRRGIRDLLDPLVVFGERRQEDVRRVLRDEPGHERDPDDPPFCGSFARISSGTLRGTLHRARADECEKMTGAFETRRAAAIVSGAACERSTSIPRRFISPTIAIPNGVSPAWRAGGSVALSAQSSVTL
jgi:hypothetical protein